MHTTSKIRVYNFSWTKSLLWPIQGQREDADCWYFCLFKLLTCSETLILVCGMLAVGDGGAVWRTDGPSKKPVQKHPACYDGAALFLLSLLNFTVLILSHKWQIIVEVKTIDICFKLLSEFLYIHHNTVIIEENKPNTPYLFSNQWTQEKKREPHSQP